MRERTRKIYIQREREGERDRERERETEKEREKGVGEEQPLHNELTSVLSGHRYNHD